MELVSLNTTHPDSRRMSIKKMGSVVLHVLLLAAVTYQFHGVAKARRARPAAAQKRLTPALDATKAKTPSHGGNFQIEILSTQLCRFR